MPCQPSVALQPAAAGRICLPSYRPIYNYRADAGAGSNTITVISESPGWRAALLGTVAAGALWLGSPRARAGRFPQTLATMSCTTATCSGNAVGRRQAASPIPTRRSQRSTSTRDQPISRRPPASTASISTAPAPATPSSSTTTRSPFDIIVDRRAAPTASMRLSNAAITINHTGDIDASCGPRRHRMRQVAAAGHSGRRHHQRPDDVTGGLTGIVAQNLAQVRCPSSPMAMLHGG